MKSFAWVHAGVFVIQLAALAVLLSHPSSVTGFPLDDAWIHQLVARRFIETGSFGIDPARFASGATSLMWPLLLAIQEALSLWSPAAFAAGVNALLYLSSGQSLVYLLRRDGVEPWHAAVAASLGMLSGNYVWFVFSGMEAMLLSALTLGAVASWTHGTGARSAALSGALLALAALTRPEAAVFCGIFVAFARWLGRRWFDVAVMAAPAAIAAIVYWMLTTGEGPSTLSGRKWLWTAYAQGAEPIVLVQELAARWAERLARYTVGVEAAEPFWAVFGLALAGAAIGARQRWRGLSLSGAVAAVHLATYAVIMPTEGHGGRYQPLVPPLFLVFASLAAAYSLRVFLKRLPKRRASFEAVAAGLVAIGFGLPVVSALAQWREDHALAVQHVNGTEVQMGNTIQALPPSARVATFDIGGIGYFSRRDLLDLGALVDPTILPFVRAGRTDELLSERAIQYVIVPMGYSDQFPDPWNFMHRLGIGASEKLHLERVVEHWSPPAIWRPSLEATLHCSPRQVLFRVIQ